MKEPTETIETNSKLLKLISNIKKVSWKIVKSSRKIEKKNKFLRFADDKFLISGNVRELENMANDLKEAGEKAGLIINIKKSAVMSP